MVEMCLDCYRKNSCKQTGMCGAVIKTDSWKKLIKKKILKVNKWISLRNKKEKVIEMPISFS